MSAAAPSIRHRDSLFIGGKWRPAAGGGRIGLVNPATEDSIGSVAEAGEADMDLAVQAARAAFDSGPWPRMSHAERGSLVAALAKRLEARHGELAAAWTRQMGGLASFARNVTIGGTFQFSYFAGLAASYPFETRQPPSMGPGQTIIVREPVGVVAAIAPWNAPYAIMAQKVAPALVAGCTVIMKPAPETPLEAYIIAECAEEVGLPPGVLNLVPAQREASDHLVRNPGVDKVGFTGSTAAGRRIASVCGERIARVTLELGGKSAALVLDDFPLEQAAGILTGTICTMTGQVCATLSRVIVSRHRYDQLAAAIVAAMAGIRVGDPEDPASQMGPLAMRRQLEGAGGKGRLRRRPPGPHEAGLLLRAHAVHRRRQRHGHRAGRDLRSGDQPDRLRGRGRCHPHRQRFHLWTQWRSVHAGRGPRVRGGTAAAHGLRGAQRPADGFHGPVRRLQAVGHRPRGWAGEFPRLHRDQDHHHGLSGATSGSNHMRSYSMKILAAATILILASGTAFGQAKSCEELKGEIEAKIRANGVAEFTLTIVDKDAPDDGKVVGTCGGGSKKILYKRGAG
jgi:hypothetical protein